MSERPTDEKSTHQAVEYERPSSHPGEACGNCRHVIETLEQVRCETVKAPIYLTGWCVRYEEKPKKKPPKSEKEEY